MTKKKALPKPTNGFPREDSQFGSGFEGNWFLLQVSRCLVEMREQAHLSREEVAELLDIRPGELALVEERHVDVSTAASVLVKVSTVCGMRLSVGFCKN